MKALLKKLYIVLIILSVSQLLQAQVAPITADHAFAFIEDQVIQLKGFNNEYTDRYLSPTNCDVDARGNFHIIKGHLYTNALAAIILTHRGFEENNSEYLDKAAGIFRAFNSCQYRISRPEINDRKNYLNIAGAFPNQIFSEEYINNKGPYLPYVGENGAYMVRHGNNSWYLIALSYYTLTQRERLGKDNAVANEFVPNLIELADYLSSPKAQDQVPGSYTEGAILFGWGDLENPPTEENRKNYISTEHQTGAFSGLIYASEVVKDNLDPEIAGKQQKYLECARKILRFATYKLYNPNLNPQKNPEDSEPEAFFFRRIYRLVRL